MMTNGKNKKRFPPNFVFFSRSPPKNTVTPMQTNARRTRTRLCNAIIVPCAGSRLWLLLALASLVAGWGLFAWAAIEASRRGTAMRGWEWVPGFLLCPLAWICITGIRPGRGSDAGERDATETEMCTRLGAVSMLVGAAWVTTCIAVPLQWLQQEAAAGPLVAATMFARLVEERGLHSSASATVSASAAPVHRDRQAVKDADRIVGVVLFVHLMVLTLSIFAYWQYGEHYRLERARLEGHSSSLDVDDDS